MSTNPSQQFKPKTTKKGTSPLMLVGIALVLALSAAFSIWHYLKQTQEKVKELTATRAVVIAARDIAANTTLTPEDLTTELFPHKTVPPDYPDKPDILIGRVSKINIHTREVVTDDKLVKTGASGGLANIIPKGQRAITIMVSDITGVGGFIKPGDRVDILSDFKATPPNGGASIVYSKTILQNVFIIATGDKLYDPTLVADPGAKSVNQLTIAVSPLETEKVALALSNGEVRFVLRPHGENEIFESEGSSAEDVYGQIAQAQIAEAPVGSIEAVQTVASDTAVVQRNRIDIILGDMRTSHYY